MKNQLFVAIILCTFLTMQVSAQITNSYDLSDYKLPELRYRALEAGIDLSGYTSKSKVDSYISDQSSFSGNVDARYYSYLNSKRLQQTSYLSISMRGERYKGEDSIGNSKRSGYSPNIRYRIDNRTYLINKFFVETDLGVDYELSAEQYYKISKSIVQADYNANRHTMAVSVPLKVGYGRIEPMYDYYQAIYIYEELLNSGRANAGKTNEEVLELAALISKLKSTRSFDSRIKNILDIEAIDSFMVANNFKTISDARYFATLIDNWHFIPVNARNSGTTIAMAFTPAYYYSFRKDKVSEITSDATTKAWSTVGGLEFRHEKPISLFWQSSTHISAYAGLTNIIENRSNSLPSSYDEEVYPKLTARLGETISYYPNTRTSVSLGVGVVYGQLYDRTDEAKRIKGVEGNSFRSYAGLYAYYYFSPRLRLDFSSKYSYQGWESPDMIITSEHDNIYSFYAYNQYSSSNAYKKKHSSASFNLSLNYSIF